MTETQTTPQATDAPTQWPPLAHIRRKKPGKALKEGDEALCGAKLMGIDLENAAEPMTVCEECLTIFRKIARGGR